MSDDDFPYLAEDRRAHWRKVVITTVAVIGAVVLFVVRLSMNEDARRVRRIDDQLNRALAEHPIDLANDVRSGFVPDAPPVELEVVLGDRHVDVDGTPIAIGDGRTVELVARPTWTYAGPDFSFEHAPSIHVIDGDSVLLTMGDVTAQLGAIDSDDSDADDLDLMFDTYRGSGQVVGTPSTPSRTMLGHPVSGKRFVAANLLIELVSAKLAPHRRLRAIVTGTSPTADLQPIVDAIQTVTAHKARPTPEFDVVIRDPAGTEVGRHPAAIGKPTKVDAAALELTIQRRETVRERRGGMAFDHAPELAVMALASAIPVIQLRNGEIGIQLMAPGMPMAVEDIANQMTGGASFENHQSITRTFGGTDYRGSSFDMSIGTLGLRVEAFSFQHGGRDFLVTVQFPADAGATALQLAGPVIASLR